MRHLDDKTPMKCDKCKKVYTLAEIKKQRACPKCGYYFYVLIKFGS